MIYILMLLLSWVVSFLSKFIDLLPTVNISVLNPTEFRDIVSAIYYFLPMDTIGVLFLVSVLITHVRIIYSIALKLKSFIPFISGSG